MTNLDILKPVVVLVAWTLVVLAWMVVRRLPAMSAAGIDLRTVRGGRPGGLDGVVPEQAQWPAHNYMHLVEQPTLFYAIALTLVVLGWGGGTDTWIAWAYVGLRIAHSVVHITVNRVAVRFALFALSTLCLLALTLHAALVLFHLHG